MAFECYENEILKCSWCYMNFIEFDFAGRQIERRLLPSKQRCHFTNNYFNGSMEMKCSKADTQKVISLPLLLTCSLKERCIKGKINNSTTDGTMELRALIFVIWSDFIGKSHFNISCSNASMAPSLSAEREFLSFVPFCESNRVKCIFE